MHPETRHIQVELDSEMARLLEEIGVLPVVLEKDGQFYRLVKMPIDLWAGYDPEKVREAIALTAGSWADLDTDTLLSDLGRARKEGSRPDSRP